MEKEESTWKTYLRGMTKLLPLNLQVTLLQVPPSKKETWGLRATQVSMCVLTQTPDDLLWLMYQLTFSVDLMNQFLSNPNDALKGI
jgi:hypothetical protein